MFERNCKKPRVLIVDDEPEIRETLRERLEFNDMAVITATDGQKGLAAAIADKPDVIITDIAMPVMDGIEMIRAFRAAENDRHIPIIVITGSGRREDFAAARELYVDECLQKPFEMSELLGKIENLLELSTANASLH